MHLELEFTTVFGFNGVHINNDTIWINANLFDSDVILQAAIFHERLHADEGRARGEYSLFQYGRGEIFRHGGHDPWITEIFLEYVSYLAERNLGILNGEYNHELPDINEADWRQETSDN